MSITASTIKDWPESQRPREKLLRYGEHTLSTPELIAILLRTGARGESAIDIACRIIAKFKTIRAMSHTDAKDWQEFKGLGPAKIAQLKAALELGRRFREDHARTERLKISSSRAAAEVMMPRMRDLKKEVFKLILLDVKNRVIDIVEAASGTVNQAYPIIREIFHAALQQFAVSIICCHNHPSGDITASPEDRAFTRELFKAGEIMGITVFDHIIIGNDTYYSFADSGGISCYENPAGR